MVISKGRLVERPRIDNSVFSEDIDDIFDKTDLIGREVCPLQITGKSLFSRLAIKSDDFQDQELEAFCLAKDLLKTLTALNFCGQNSISSRADKSLSVRGILRFSLAIAT